MEIKAQLNYLRVAPRKVRLIADLIRGMDVKDAETQLKFIPKRATGPLLKLLNSAIANAKNNFNIEEKNSLYIKKITIDEGPPFKRWRAGSRGRANPVAKRTSHVNLVLDIREGVKVDKPIKATDKKAPTAVGVPTEVGKETEKEAKTKPKAPKEIKKGKDRKDLFKKVFKRKSF